MRRRSFLAGSVAACVRAQPAAADEAMAAEEFVWDLPPNRYVIRVRDVAVTCDCYSADLDMPPLPPALPDDAAWLRVGRQQRPVHWQVVEWQQDEADSRLLVLHARSAPLAAEIRFSHHPASGIIAQDVVVRHIGKEATIPIVAALSGWFAVAEPVERLLYLAGEWAQEMQVQRGQALPLVMESRTGKTGFAFQPYLALLANAATSLCVLEWSGNWILRAARHGAGLAVYGGLNPWRFRDRLRPGGVLRLPRLLFGRFPGGLNRATQALHDYRRAHRPDPARPIAVQFNSWYPYFGDVTSDTMLAMVPVARRLGCEAFTVDAGWYRTDEGDSDADWMARTGDWRVSRRRFPNGLREVSARCHAEGLRFGLWFEPEMIGPESSIRRQHPEWLHHIGGQAPQPHERAVLNLGVPAAWQHVHTRVTRILRAVGVDWMKWDFNADLFDGGWAPGLPATLTDQDVLVAHYRGLYRLQDAIRAEFPALTLEMCASGGSRLDGAILSHAHVAWISDQPGPLRKLAIHFGASLAHPAMVCNDWLVEWPPAAVEGYDELDMRGDLAFRLRVAMLGSFGFSVRADRWSAADLAEAAAHTTLYCERIRPLIQFGDQYRLTRSPSPAGEGGWAAMWYVAKDGSAAALFVFRLDAAETQLVCALPGLHAARRYRVQRFAGASAEVAGAALAAGLAVVIVGRFASALYTLEML